MFAMNRAKVMLLAIAVIASIGAAQAFKMGKLKCHQYCYLTTDTQPPIGQCTAKGDCFDIDLNGTRAIIFYTITTNLNQCAAALCPNSAAGPLL
jgi:hypothetical protein